MKDKLFSVFVVVVALLFVGQIASVFYNTMDYVVGAISSAHIK